MFFLKRCTSIIKPYRVTFHPVHSINYKHCLKEFKYYFTVNGLAFDLTQEGFTRSRTTSACLRDIAALLCLQLGCPNSVGPNRSMNILSSLCYRGGHALYVSLVTIDYSVQCTNYQIIPSQYSLHI